MRTWWVLGVVLLLCLSSAVVTVVLINRHIQDSAGLASMARMNAQAEASNAANQINDRLTQLRDIGISLADDLSSGRLSDQDVEARLLKEVAQNDVVSAVTVAYVPEFVPQFAISDGGGTGTTEPRYSPYAYAAPGQEPKITRIDQSYDYTLPDGTPGPDGTTLRTDWYHLPLAHKEGVWGEPYYGSSTKVYWAGFGVPFYRARSNGAEPELAGVVDVSLTLTQFQELVANIQVGNNADERSISPGSSYGFIISQSGKFISYPSEELVTEGRNISSLPGLPSIEQLRSQADVAMSGDGDSEPILVNYTDEKSQREFWVFLAPIRSSNWWVGIALDRTEFLLGEDVQRLRHQRIGIALGGMSFLTFLSVLGFGAYRGNAAGLWFVSSVFSVLAIALLAYMWYLNVNAVGREDNRDILLVDKATTDKVINDISNDISGPTYVPTGILIESVEFVSASNVILTGYIWQTYSTKSSSDSSSADVSQGFVLPEASSSTITEAYRKTEDGMETIGWKFQAQFRREFTFSNYPFDRESLWVRFWHTDFNRNVVLIPDLQSYYSTNPAVLPGIEQQDLAVPGWDLTRSFFSYRENRYNTTFGIPNFTNEDALPDLYFNVGLKREFVNIFVSNLIPVILVAVLLFAVLLTVTGREEPSHLLGFSASTVLSFCAALFFVVIVAHINLRTSLEARGLIYLELFYLVMYGAILIVGINSLLIASGIDIKLVEYRNNILVRLLFWPVILGILLAVTLITFR